MVHIRVRTRIWTIRDAGLWVKAKENAQASQLVQKIRKEFDGVTDIYPIPTFPHGSADST